MLPNMRAMNSTSSLSDVFKSPRSSLGVQETIFDSWKSPAGVGFGVENAGASTILERTCMRPVSPRAHVFARDAAEEACRAFKPTRQAILMDRLSHFNSIIDGIETILGEPTADRTADIINKRQ